MHLLQNIALLVRKCLYFLLVKEILQRELRKRRTQIDLWKVDSKVLIDTLSLSDHDSSQLTWF